MNWDNEWINFKFHDVMEFGLPPKDGSLNFSPSGNTGIQICFFEDPEDPPNFGVFIVDIMTKEVFSFDIEKSEFSFEEIYCYNFFNEDFISIITAGENVITHHLYNLSRNELSLKHRTTRVYPVVIPRELITLSFEAVLTDNGYKHIDHSMHLEGEDYLVIWNGGTAFLIAANPFRNHLNPLIFNESHIAAPIVNQRQNRQLTAVVRDVGYRGVIWYYPMQPMILGTNLLIRMGAGERDWIQFPIMDCVFWKNDLNKSVDVDRWLMTGDPQVRDELEHNKMHSAEFATFSTQLVNRTPSIWFNGEYGLVWTRLKDHFNNTEKLSKKLNQVNLFRLTKNGIVHDRIQIKKSRSSPLIIHPTGALLEVQCDDDAGFRMKVVKFLPRPTLEQTVLAKLLFQQKTPILSVPGLARINDHRPITVILPPRPKIFLWIITIFALLLPVLILFVVFLF